MIEENTEKNKFLEMLNNFKKSETEFFSLIVTIIDKSKTQNNQLTKNRIIYDNWR